MIDEEDEETGNISISFFRKAADCLAIDMRVYIHLNPVLCIASISFFRKTGDRLAIYNVYACLCVYIQNLRLFCAFIKRKQSVCCPNICFIH